MTIMRRFRFSMGTMMMFVLAAATAAALFAKVRGVSGLGTIAGMKTDVPLLFLLAIGLTSVALGAWKDHTVVQILLQGTVACLGCLTLIWLAEAGLERALRYWFQGAFAATIAIPMLARRHIKREMPRGPRREWWKRTCEAVSFAFLTILLVALGTSVQFYLGMGMVAMFKS